MAKTKITDKDLYEMLEILPSATEQEIKKAYRKKALKCHPDKNPDNPKAAELFHELSAALEILTDIKAREAYDRTLKAKEAAKQRTKELDAKRRKLKEDLERREREAKESSLSSQKNHLSDEERLQKEIERLQKEGSRALREEQELIRQQIIREQQGKFSYMESVQETKINTNNNVPRIKVKWSSSVQYDHPKIMDIFKKYGHINELVVLKKSALIEFENQIEADFAFAGESCIKDNPLKLEWISKREDKKVIPPTARTQPTFASFSNSRPQPAAETAASMKSFNDFEAMILGKLAVAAAEQKRAASEKSKTVANNSSENGDSKT